MGVLFNGTRGRLVSQRVVMHLTHLGPIRAYFDEWLDEPGVAREFVLSVEDFCDMGSPEVITLTIKPGDLLNEAK